MSLQTSHSPLTITTQKFCLSITVEKHTVVYKKHMVTSSCSPSFPPCSVVRCFQDSTTCFCKNMVRNRIFFQFFSKRWGLSFSMELFILFRFGRLTVWNKKWNKVVQSQFKFIPFFIPFGRNGTQNQNRDPPSTPWLFLQVLSPFLSTLWLIFLFRSSFSDQTVERGWQLEGSPE